MVTAVEENNLCACEMVTNAKRGRRGQRNQRGERKSQAKLSERQGESWGRMADGIFRYVFMVLPQMTVCEDVARVFIGREKVPVEASSAESDGDLWCRRPSPVADGRKADSPPQLVSVFIKC